MKSALLGGILSLGFATASVAGPLPVARISKVLKGYAESIGCNYEFDKKDIVETDVDLDGEKEFVVVYALDVGCAGGSGTTGSRLAVLRRRDEFHMDDIFLDVEKSEPAAMARGLPRWVDSLTLKSGRLRYRGWAYQEGDSNAEPSVPVDSQLDLVKTEVSLDAGFKKTIYIWKSQKAY